MTFGEKFKNLREERGFSQDNLAAMLFETTQNVIEWENNNVMPSADQLVKISRIFGISIDELLGNTENKDYACPIAKAEIITEKKEINEILRFRFLNAITTIVSIALLVALMFIVTLFFSLSINTSTSEYAISGFDTINILIYPTILSIVVFILVAVRHNTILTAYNQHKGNLLFYNSFFTIQYTDGSSQNIQYLSIKKHIILITTLCCHLQTKVLYA